MSGIVLCKSRDVGRVEDVGSVLNTEEQRIEV